ncbi:hypothetical protein EHE19_014230 [Ruminiclostridium herbifermentans]|uniref:Uncharacterized protein n=1 Tax=Ruminiclostridium herbifermentans TaxID=2488810 RepID=A0A7H1VKW9_9FIRM|nr:hypothetical protein [Ruminiclostridium herbifermentans]QNU66031.1 hypothetical protein EHE19_014230 [Ruminiclostridium herbifermentans]
MYAEAESVPKDTPPLHLINPQYPETDDAAKVLIGSTDKQATNAPIPIIFFYFHTK